MMNPLAPRLALLLAERGLVREMRLSLAAKALLHSAEGSEEEAPLLLAEEGSDQETRLSLAAKAPASLPLGSQSRRCRTRSTA